jgi:hypothetical protein
MTKWLNYVLYLPITYIQKNVIKENLIVSNKQLLAGTEQ